MQEALQALVCGGMLKCLLSLRADYHLHVHVTHMHMDLGPGMAAGKAHLLDDVIGAPSNAAHAREPIACLCLTINFKRGMVAQSALGTVGVEPSSCTAVAFHARPCYDGQDALLWHPWFCLV